MTRQFQDSGIELFKSNFSALEDPRRTTKGNIVYSLEELLFLTISAVVSGCNTWELIAGFGQLKLDWLRKYYPYKRVPSHDTLGKFFSVLDAEAFGVCFINWINDVVSKVESDVVAIDGKTIRGSLSKGNKFPLHVVSAFCTQNRLCLGQQVVAEKGNELTAIPQLLALLTLDECIVTIDGIGCQKGIAEKIRSRGGHYILQVKDNQKDLKEQIVDAFESRTDRLTDNQLECGHGRIERRICEAMLVSTTIIDGAQHWKDLQTIVRIKTERTIKATNKTSTEHRYYITSLGDNARVLNQSIRSHWGIENNLHWNLDVIFGEDGQLKRKGNSAQNFNIICKTALALLDSQKSMKLSKPMKRFRASMDDAYRESILRV